MSPRTASRAAAMIVTTLNADVHAAHTAPPALALVPGAVGIVKIVKTAVAPEGRNDVTMSARVLHVGRVPVRAPTEMTQLVTMQAAQQQHEAPAGLDHDANIATRRGTGAEGSAEESAQQGRKEG